MELSEYELLRIERMKRNAERLKALGLDQNLFKKVKPKKKRTVSKIKRVKPGEERRSKRLSADKRNGDLVMLDYRAKDGEEIVSKQDGSDYDYEYGSDDCDDTDYVSGRRQHRSRSNRIVPEKWRLSEKDRESLASGADDNFMAKFEEFLEYENRISEQNKRNVMRQAWKLALGEGIRYESPKYGWPEGCYFKKGEKITPMSDIVELMIEGQACEDRWGRDHGNGWLISHPLKKLLLFQQFILNNPDFLTSELRLMDYCNADVESPPSSPRSVAASIYKNGTIIRRKFDQEWYEGEIVDYDSEEGFYKVKYMDGDSEELTRDEVTKHLNIYKNGTIIRRKFDKEWYEGEIVDYDIEEGFYKVKYTDGDSEELTRDEVTKCMKSNQKYS